MTTDDEDEEARVRVTSRLAAFVRGSLSRRPRRDDGVTVMEIIVAMTIIGVVMSSASLFFISGLRNTGGHSMRQTAVTLANQKLESVQSISPSTLISGRDCTQVYTYTHSTAGLAITAQDQVAASVATQPAAGNCDTTVPLPAAAVLVTEPATVSGVAYTMDTYIDVCWLAGSITSGTCGPTNTGGTLTQMYRASVDVSFAPTSGLTCSGYATSRCDYVASTLIDPSKDPTFNSNIVVPKVTGVSPAGIRVGTTQSITLSGSNFVNGIAVSIASTGGIVTAITANTGTSLTFTLAASNTAGSYTVTLLNPDGGTATTSVTVNPNPVITSITSPVPPSTATTLTILGTGFQAGATISVNTGGTLSLPAFVSSTKLTVLFTANSTTGTRTITVTNPDGGTDTDTFTVQSVPTISSISPSTVGAGATNQTLTLTGTGFVSGATITVSSGGTTNSATVLSSTSATVKFSSSGSTGSKSLTLTNPDGGTTSASFTVNPTITSFGSSLTCSASNQTVTMSGTGFVSGATVSDGGDTFVTVNVTSSTTVSLSILRTGLLSGSRTLVFTNPDGTSASATLSATNCAAPTITTVTPGSGSVNEPLTITLAGSGFLSGATVTSTKGTPLPGVSYGTASLVTVNGTGTSITFTWSAPTTGSSAQYNFTVTQDGDTVTKSVTYSKIT